MEKKYDHLSTEQEIKELWQKENIYTFDPQRGPLYSIDTPPPTVSGSLHIGHIFSYTQTDIIARYKRLQGFSVLYPFGFDDNGLATERFVEKKLNVASYKMSRSDFINLCLKETEQVEQEFKKLWESMGLSVDWSLWYSTINDLSRTISQKSFINLYKKDLVYRKEEPALFCTTCRTSVAQAELDDAEKPTVFYEIAFTIYQNNQILMQASIATTRPELLSSCVAVFYHPADQRYQKFKNCQAQVPIFNNLVPLIADEQVIPEKGTGLVMCCTFGDKTDIEWFKKYNLPYKPSLGTDGRWLERTNILSGLTAQQARQTIVEALTNQELLKNQKPLVHAVNIHERCKQPIEYILLSQWFLKILPFKERFIKAADTIQWFPTYMKTRYINWVENISWDWCLSRQRFYGIPFPVWHCLQCKAILLPEENQLPIDPQETAYKGVCHRCSSADIQADTDVMDTWNTSSLTPYIIYSLMHPEENNCFNKTQISFLPMSMRPQAHDIIRTWAFYTIIKTMFHHETTPWKDIVISGHVLSSQKEKISKSQANSPLQPENLLKNYSADAIRYWTATGTLGTDTAFSETQLMIGQKLLVKLWNAFRFVQEHTTDFIPSATSYSKYAVHNWILERATACYQNYQKALEHHEVSSALEQINHLFWHDFCDNYLELIKDYLFNPSLYEAQEVAATKATLYAMGLRILQLYAPFTPYSTEKLYQHIYRKNEKIKSLHLTLFTQQKEYPQTENSKIMNAVLAVIEQVRKLKSEQQLSLKTELTQLIISATPESIERLKGQEKLIKGITRALKVNYTTDPHLSVLTHHENGWHAFLTINTP
jgi:valyl-tRNA synthetase